MRDPLEFKALPDEAFGDGSDLPVFGFRHTLDEVGNFVRDADEALWALIFLFFHRGI